MLAMSHFLVRPKPELKEVLGEASTSFLMTPHLWQKEIWVDENGTNVEYNLTYVKMVFMLQLVTLWKDTTSIQLKLNKILGSPIKFSVEVFDKWWTIEHITRYELTDEFLEFVTPEEVELLDSTQHEEIFNSIKYKVEHKSRQ